jgi:PEP-CTERM motif-containing protein
MIRRNWFARLLAAALVAVGMAAPAKAGLLPVSVSIQPEAGNFRWTYSVVLPQNMQLQAGDYFTLYDFAGYTGSAGVSSPFPDESYGSHWSVSNSNSGPTPGRVIPNDDPNATNLTWTYNGPTLSQSDLYTSTNNGTLGNFFASSTLGDMTGTPNSFFAGVNHVGNSGPIDQNVTETYTPTGQIIVPTPTVPEPATLALAGLGLPFVGVARFIRRRKK